MRVTLGGFDTHGNQPATQARLLGELGQGLVALRSALESIGHWDDTLVLTYAEFGRRPKENQSGGTDHGTASVHFALGGAVRAASTANRRRSIASTPRQPRARDRLPQRLRDGARALVGHGFGAVLGGRFPPLAFLPA